MPDPTVGSPWCAASREAGIWPRSPQPVAATTSAPTAPAGGEGASERLAPADELPLRPLAWADLLRRVFAVGVLECPRCGARTRLLAAIYPPDATRAILECLDLPARAPPVEAARPEQHTWDPIFADEGA